MIRASAKKPDGTTIIILGLSDENVKRMCAGRPVFVKGSTVNKPDVEIIVYHGRTEYELTEGMAKMIGPETEIRKVQPHELPPDHPDYREAS